MLLMNDDTKTKNKTSPSKFVFPKTSKEECVMSLLLAALLGGVIAGAFG